MEIISGLYLGSCHASYNKDALSRLNVKYIVNCSGQDNFYGDVTILTIVVDRSSHIFMCI